MSDGLSDYLDDEWNRGARDMQKAFRDWYARPIVPRREDIRVINPPPPYHWLGREAETA